MPKTPNFQHYAQTLSKPIRSMLTQNSLLNKTKTIAKKCHLQKGQDEETLLTLSLMIRQKFEITHKFKEPNDTTEVYQQFCSMLELPQKQGSLQQVLKTEAKELVKEKLNLVASMLSTEEVRVTKNQNKNNNNYKKKKAENTSNENQDEYKQQKESKQQLERILDIVQQEQEKLQKIARQAEAQQEAIMCEQEEQFFK